LHQPGALDGVSKSPDITAHAHPTVCALPREKRCCITMNQRLSAFLADLYAEGAAHDAAQPDRLLKRRNLEPATAELLSLVARISGARQVVEIGTANGYSTIWLADAVTDTGGHVISIDTAANEEARTNLARADGLQAGLAHRVEWRQEDGGAYLATLPDSSVDLLFLDAERVEYPKWWPHPTRVLRPGGVLGIDNVLSHADEVAPFLTLLSGEGTFVSATVAVGKGLHLAWRRWLGSNHLPNVVDQWRFSHPRRAGMTNRPETSTPANTPTPIGPYHHIARVGPFISIGGTAGVNPVTGQLAGADVGSQARQILESFRVMLQSVGSDLDHIIHVNVFLKNMGDFDEMNRAYIEMMGDHRPARTVIGVSELPKPGILLTMNLTAVTRE
jgi:reactive intermediate/imine deaminase